MIAILIASAIAATAVPDDGWTPVAASSTSEASSDSDGKHRIAQHEVEANWRYEDPAGNLYTVP